MMPLSLSFLPMWEIWVDYFFEISQIIFCSRHFDISREIFRCSRWWVQTFDYFIMPFSLLSHFITKYFFFFVDIYFQMIHFGQISVRHYWWFSMTFSWHFITTLMPIIFWLRRLSVENIFVISTFDVFHFFDAAFSRCSLLLHDSRQRLFSIKTFQHFIFCRKFRLFSAEVASSLIRGAVMFFHDIM